MLDFKRKGEERRGGDGTGSAREAFNLIQELALLDLPLNERSFTWTNMREQPRLAKLDRIIVSHKWENLHPLATMTIINNTTSDHTLLFLITEDAGRTRQKHL